MASKGKRRIQRSNRKRAIKILVSPRGKLALRSGVEYTIQISVSDDIQPDLGAELKHRIPLWVDLWGAGNVRATVSARRFKT